MKFLPGSCPVELNLQKKPRVHSYFRQKESPKPEGIIGIDSGRETAGHGLASLDTHSRRTVLDPCSSHFLLVDNVHQLDGICTLHIYHWSLEWIF